MSAIATAAEAVRDFACHAAEVLAGRAAPKATQGYKVVHRDELVAPADQAGQQEFGLGECISQPRSPGQIGETFIGPKLMPPGQVEGNITAAVRAVAVAKYREAVKRYRKLVAGGPAAMLAVPLAEFRLLLAALHLEAGHADNHLVVLKKAANLERETAPLAEVPALRKAANAACDEYHRLCSAAAAAKQKWLELDGKANNAAHFGHQAVAELHRLKRDNAVLFGDLDTLEPPADPAAE